jgi:hypothetical protein
MKRSEYKASSMHLEAVDLMAAVAGAGTGAPTVVATTVMAAADNFAASATRTSEGLYVVQLKEHIPEILQVVPTIERASGVLKHVNVVSWSETGTSTGSTVTVQVSLAAGSGVDDIETTDVLRLRVYGRLSLA